jgi:hypothetical protein
MAILILGDGDLKVGGTGAQLLNIIYNKKKLV